MIQRLRYQAKVTVHTGVYVFYTIYKNACFDPPASKPRSARSLLAVKEIQTQRKYTKVVPLTIGSQDVGTLMDSAGSNRPQPRAALDGRELGRHKIQQP